MFNRKSKRLLKKLIEFQEDWVRCKPSWDKQGFFLCHVKQDGGIRPVNDSNQDGMVYTFDEYTKLVKFLRWQLN